MVTKRRESNPAFSFRFFPQYNKGRPGDSTVKKVFDIDSSNLNEIVIDKNQYYLKLKNTDNIVKIAETFKKIIIQNFNNETEVSEDVAGTCYSRHTTYFKNIDCGRRSAGLKIKNHGYGWWAIQFWNLYNVDTSWNRWSRALKTTRYNTDLIIEHGKQDFRFVVTSEVLFPMSKYLKYIKSSFLATDERKKEQSVKKFVSSLTWMSIFGDFQNRGWEDIKLNKSFDDFSYRGTLQNGALLEIKLQKNSEEDDPRFTIWLVKGQLGRNIKKEAMMALVESLLIGEILEGKKIEDE